MQRCFACIFLIAALWAITLPAAHAHTPSDPNFLQPDFYQQWKTLSTPHFRIHHQAAHADFARQMATVAERVHARLSPWLGWQPADKTEIVILDSVDLSNGGASPLPYNRFFIYMPTPVEGEILDNDPWIELVFTHEYTHILQLDMVSAAPKVMRELLGRSTFIPFVFFTFPELFAPSWVTEGFAVYSESDNDTGYGRLNNAWYEAMMRAEVERGLRSLTEESFEGYSGSRWPYGQIYLYGAYFFKFVEERYGHDKVLSYIRIYSRNVLPWRMDKRAYQIFGKSAQAVWSEYQDYLRQRFAPQLAAIRRQSALTSRLLYDAPYTNELLAPAGNGDLYFYHNDDSSHPAVQRLHPDGRSERMFEADEVQHLDWQDGAGLLVSKLAVCDNVNAYNDLYRWRPGMGEPERLTRCGRYARAMWRPDGQAIAAVQLDRGLTRLVLLNAQGGQAQTLAELPAGDALGHIAWSPDQTTIAAAVKRLHTGWHIELFDLATRHWRSLTLNGDREIRPRFSRDGSAIYFLSDHGKVWNLRRIHLADNTIETVSNTTTGIYEAALMADGGVRLLEHTPRGQAITALDASQAIGTPYPARNAHPPEVKSIVTAADYQPAPYENVQDYSALATLAPRAWLPIAAVNSADKTSYVGVMLSGMDTLGFHTWSVAPLYYTNQGVLGGFAAYDFYNTLTFSALHQYVASPNTNAAVRFRDNELRYEALLHHSFNGFDADWYTGAGIVGEHVRSEAIAGPPAFYETRDTLAGAIGRYDDTEFYRRSISPVDGRHVQVSRESYDVLGGNFHHDKTDRLDWNEYFGLGQNHVLLLRWQQARGDRNIAPYVLGGETPPLNPLSTDLELGRRNFMLRGYQAGAPSLIGTHFAIGTVEWRIPVCLCYDGYFVPPFGVGRESLTLFVDRGGAWSDGTKAQLKTGAGLEWNLEALIGYDVLALGITVGYAHGFEKDGGNRFYARLGMPF